MVRVDVERLEQFERAAKAVGKPVSTWLRDIGVSSVSVPEASDAVYAPMLPAIQKSNVLPKQQTVFEAPRAVQVAQVGIDPVQGGLNVEGKYRPGHITSKWFRLLEECQPIWNNGDPDGCISKWESIASQHGLTGQFAQWKILNNPAAQWARARELAENEVKNA